jgi:glycine/sarcosine N-methyltransferase
LSENDLWDTLSGDYDRFVNWPERLARELPSLEGFLRENGAQRVLDAACGTGHHALALAQRGYDVLGVDASAGMIERARQNAKAAGVAARFEQIGFGALGTVASEPFDAVLCLGNSLPSLLSEDALEVALEDMAGVLAPGGLLVVQNLNYDRVWPKRERFLPLETHVEDGEEWLFFRFVDFHEETLTFNMAILHKENGTWDRGVASTELRPILAEELARHLRGVGLARAETYGDYSRRPYDPQESGDLIVVARKG